MKKFLVPAVLAVATAAIIFTLPRSSAPPRQLALIWDYTPNADNPASNVVFLIRATTNLALPAAHWPIVAVVPTNGWRFPASLPFCFYRVSSSNSVRHLTSDYPP